MLEVRDQDEADDDHEEPRGDLLRRDDIPRMYLTRVLPRTDIRPDILCNPDEKRDEEEREAKRHPPALRSDGEVYSRLPEENENGGDEEEAEIVDEVVGKEIQIDERAEYDAPYIVVVILHLQFHYFPRLTDIAPYRRVHESAVERHGGNLKKSFFGIAPRADHRARFVQFEDKTDDVKKKNYFYFVFRLPFRVVQDDLYQNGGDKEKVVAGEPEEWDVARDDEEKQKRTGKNSRPRLLEPKNPKLPHVPL